MIFQTPSCMRRRRLSSLSRVNPTIAGQHASTPCA